MVISYFLVYFLDFFQPYPTRSRKLRDILVILCSSQMESEGRRPAIPLTTLKDYTLIELTIDSADEVDAQLNLIKGGGEALLREKSSPKSAGGRSSS